MAMNPMPPSAVMDRGREDRQMRVPELSGSAFPPLPTPGSPVGGRPRSPASGEGPQENSHTERAPGGDRLPQGGNQNIGPDRKTKTARKSLGGVDVGP
eukprot:6400545-Heterocapsa_arctica.AAC.1